MFRIIFILFIILISLFFTLQFKTLQKNIEKPTFLKTDTIAENHTAKILVEVKSIYKPNETELNILQKDYSNIWAHLNHLYNTNDVESGKEYYTEDWFKLICSHYNGKIKNSIIRKDEEHSLHIQNWANDGLICTITDSVVLTYTLSETCIEYSEANIAMVLMLQGDHWRIDALRIINETKF